MPTERTADKVEQDRIEELITRHQGRQQAQLLLRAEEAGHRLALGRATTYKLIASGELRSVKIGASRRVPVDAVDEFIARLVAGESA